MSREHFSFGTGPSHFSTTNGELMRSESMPLLGSIPENKAHKENMKLTKLMRNHHFDFGRDKTDFRSTFNTNFVVHNFKGR